MNFSGTFGEGKGLKFLLFVSCVAVAKAVSVHCENCWRRQECEKIVMVSSCT